MIAVVNGDYSYLNYDENRTIESYIEFHGCIKAEVTPDEILRYAKRTIIFDEQAAPSFGRDEAGMDVTADGETGFMYIGSHYAACCFGLDALAFAMTKVGLTTTIKRGFIILQSPTLAGKLKYGNYGLENLWRTGHRCGLVSRLVNENPSGSLTLSDGTIIYSFPGLRQPSSFRGSQMAFVGRKPLMIGGEGIKVKNFVTPFKNLDQELYIAQLGAIGARSSGVSVKDFTGYVRFDDGDSAMVAAQIEKLRSFENSFSENQFNLIELTKSSAYSQEAEMLSAVSPRDITGDAAELFRSGLLLESSLKAVLQLWNEGTYDSFGNHSIYDLVTIKDDFAGLLTKYKDIKERLKKQMLFGTIQQLSACADYVCEYASSHINELLQESASSGAIREKMVQFNSQFKSANNGWDQNPDDAINIGIPSNMAFSVIDKFGVFHPRLSDDMNSNELSQHIDSMSSLLNPLLNDDCDYDLVFTPSNKGGLILSKTDNGKEKVWFSHGVLLRKVDSSVFSFESYATGNTSINLSIGEEINIDDFIVKIKSATTDSVVVLINGSSRTCVGRWIEGDVVDTGIAKAATERMMSVILEATLDRDFRSGVADSLEGLITKKSNMIASVNSVKPSYTTGCLWWKKTHEGRGDFNASRMRYVGASMILSNDGACSFEHHFEHRITGWFMNGCTTSVDTAGADRQAIRDVLSDAVVCETRPDELYIGNAQLAEKYLNDAGTSILIGYVGALVLLPGLGLIVGAAVALGFLIAAFAFFCNRYEQITTSSTLSSIRFNGHYVRTSFDISQVIPEGKRNWSLVTSAISSAASDVAYTKIEPMLRTLKKSSIREMLVMCNSASEPTSIFTVQTANAMFYVDASMTKEFKKALEDLIASDDDYKPTFELFLSSLGKLLDGASDPRCVYHTRKAIEGAIATPSADAFDMGLQYAVKEF